MPRCWRARWPTSIMPEADRSRAPSWRHCSWSDSSRRPFRGRIWTSWRGIHLPNRDGQRAVKPWVCGRSTLIWKTVMAKALKVLPKLDRFGRFLVATRYVRVVYRESQNAPQASSPRSLAQCSRIECETGRPGSVIAPTGPAADRVPDAAAAHGAGARQHPEHFEAGDKQGSRPARTVGLHPAQTRRRRPAERAGPAHGQGIGVPYGIFSTGAGVAAGLNDRG